VAAVTDLLAPAAPRAPVVARRRPGRLARAVGGFFLWTSGIHVGIVAAAPELYRSFADGAMPFVRDAWADVFMAHPALWGLAIALGQLLIGLTTLRGGRWTLLGLSGAIAFHGCLQLFGWGFALWTVPAVAVLAEAMRREIRTDHG
jgi:hypothetical protein